MCVVSCIVLYSVNHGFIHSERIYPDVVSPPSAKLVPPPLACYIPGRHSAHFTKTYGNEIVIDQNNMTETAVGADYKY